MRHSLKNRIISVFTVLLLTTSTVGPMTMAFEEGEQEASLYAVMSEKSESAEVSVFSSSDESEIEVVCASETDAEIEAEEGLEVMENYLISDREDSSDEILYVQAEQDEEVSLLPRECMSIYSVEDDELDEVIIEDIAEEENPCEIENDITGFALVKDSGMRHLNLEVCPDSTKESRVKLDGMMPKDAIAEVVDVTEENVIAAYDITIKEGDEEYQPSEDKPIEVAILNSDIKADSNIQLWHIKDDGTKEQIKDFDVEDGKVSFSATGFSVYKIVEDLYQYDLVASLDELDTERADGGFYLFYGENNFFTNVINGDGALNEVTDLLSSAIWFFESDGPNYKIFTYVNGDKKYINTADGNKIKLNSSAGDSIIISSSSVEKAFYFKKNDKEKWLQHSNGGKGIRYYDNNTNTVNCSIKICYADIFSDPNDPFGINGKSYGLMNYESGSIGNAFMADSSTNYQSMVDLIVRSEDGVNTYQVSEKTDVTMWTFHAVSGGYTLSADVGGIAKYLRMDASGISLVDEAEASTLSMTVGTGTNANKVQIKANEYTLIYNANAGFIASKTSTTNSWLNFIQKADLPDNNYVAFSAEKVSVSEVQNGQKVILYTRVWNNQKSSYEFYAVNHLGKLVPCYERGDDIMWVGNQINTLEWDFTEYYWEGTTNPNNYYELYNPYSKKYLTPQIDTELLSDTKIGINLPGRRDGEYYTDIIAWDEKNYSYAGVKADVEAGEIVHTKRKEAGTFYFAKVEPIEPRFTIVDTIENEAFGISMKMADLNSRTQMSDIIGDNDEKHNPGLLSTNLIDGYPTCKSGQSLKNLYTNETEVDHLFISSTYEASGYFEFDSCQNFATLIQEDGSKGKDFIVYKELGTTDSANKTTLKHGQFFPYDTIQPGKYASVNGVNLYSALADYHPGHEKDGLLEDDDPRKYEKLYTVGNSPNYYNAMELEASFVQTADGNDAWDHPIIFEFTGDDDFWLYVDGELVIDLGGIHSALAGSINFATGEVVVNKQQTNLRQVFADNYKKRNPTASADEVNAYLAEYFAEGKNIFKKYSSHKMKVFYMERGAGASNLHMRFNLSYVKKGNVIFKKEVSGTDKLDFDLVEYAYQIYYRDKKDSEAHEEGTLLRNVDKDVNVTYQNSTKPVDYIDTGYKPIGYDEEGDGYDAVYLLTPDRNAVINFPSTTFDYRIVEISLNKDIYEDVVINEDTTPITPDEEDVGGNRYSYDSGWLSVESNSHITFNNKVNEDGLKNLKIKKELYDSEGNMLSEDDDPTTYGFRLYLSNGVSQDLELASMYKYRVTDEAGYYCYWDSSIRRFKPTEYKNFEAIPDYLPEGQEGHTKEECIFETSLNGTISEIPPSYTVEVPIIPVDMSFMLEERTQEVPLGYKLIEYERTDLEDGGNHKSQKPISGVIKADENPRLVVRNKRGWEIEVTKDWSDKDFSTDHEAIYTAAFVGENMIADSVRCIKYPTTSLRYFFDRLEVGSTFDQYSIREVKVENPVIDADDETVVTSYTGATPITDGDFTQISTTAKGSDVSKPYWYSVTYDQGEPTGVIEDGNVRKDTINNTRGGGIVISLYEWGSQQLTQKVALPNGVFTLAKKDGEEIGTFTSDKRGRVTILYDFERDTEYVITETKTPDRYIGLPYPVYFKVTSDNEIIWTDDEKDWVICHTADIQSADEKEIVAYVDIYNKPVELKVIKQDKDSKRGLPGAHFALYRSVASGIGGEIKDYNPIPGYEDLVSGIGGVLEKVDSTLEPGKYYLTETEAPPGFISESNTDVVFVITDRREIEFVSAGEGVIHTDTNIENKVICEIDIPNRREGEEKYLTVTKSVKGNFGNKFKKFKFTFEVTGATSADEFTWYMNGEEQTAKLHSGDEFELRHGDTVTIEMNAGTEVTITEYNENYKTKIELVNATDTVVAEKNKMTFTVDNDTTLSVTNTLEGVVPTGIWLPIGILIIAGTALLFAMIRGRKRIRQLKEDT